MTKNGRKERIFALVVALLLVVTAAAFAQGDAFGDAMTLFQQRRWSEAAAAFEAVESSRPAQTEALFYAGKSFAALDRYADASIAFSQYLLTHPQSDEAAYLLAYMKFKENKPAESLNLFTAAASIKPPQADDLKIVALDYVLLNDQNSAARYLEQALVMKPDSVEIRYDLGRVRYQQNQFASAIAAFGEVLRRDPKHVKAENNLGLSLEATNQIDDAMIAYRKAIELDELSEHHSEQPYLNLGILLSKLGRPAESLPLLQKAEVIALTSAKVHYELGKTFFNLDKLSDAERELEESARIEPNDGPTHFLLGRLYKRMGDSEKATNEFALTEKLIEANRHGGVPMGDASPKAP